MFGCSSDTLSAEVAAALRAVYTTPTSAYLKHFFVPYQKGS
nr:hypothetical protein JG3_0060 [uncultured bacterium]